MTARIRLFRRWIYPISDLANYTNAESNTHHSATDQTEGQRDQAGRQAGRHVAAPHNLSRCVIISPSMYIECDNCLDFLHKNQLRVCIILPTTTILNLFGKQTRILNLR